MRRYVLPCLCALMLAMHGCRPGDGDGAASADSGLALAAAEAVSATLREMPLGERSQGAGSVTIEPGEAAWDTLFASELRRLTGGGAATGAESSMVIALSTHGVRIDGDTASVAVVLRTCSPGDSTLNFSRDSLVHRLVRGREGARWQLAGPVMHDHAVGVCAPADSAAAPR